MEKEYCTRCNKEIKNKNKQQAELSNTNNRYYPEGIPKTHVSQGWFYFGNECIKKPNEEFKNE